MKKTTEIFFDNDGNQTDDRSKAVITLTLGDHIIREHFDQPTADEAAIKAAGKEVVDWVEDRTDDTVTDTSAKPIVTMTKDDIVIKQPKKVAAFSADNADDALGQLVDFNKRHYVQPNNGQQQNGQQQNQQPNNGQQQNQQPNNGQQQNGQQQNQQPNNGQQQNGQQQNQQPRRDPFDFSKAFHEETQEDLIAQNNDQIDFFRRQLEGSQS